MIYFSHDTEYDPKKDPGLGRLHFVHNEEQAWDDVGDSMWEWWKGDDDDNVIRRYASLYTMPPDADDDDDICPDVVKIGRCKYVGTRSFCISPHAPECNNSMVISSQHRWNESSAKDIGDSEWKGCRDMAVPCSQCDILKIIQISNESINNTSKQTTVRYEPKSVLEHASVMIVAKPKEPKHVKSQKKHSRICGAFQLFGDDVILFRADYDDMAIRIAESRLRNSYYNDKQETAYIKYYVGVAQQGTKITDNIYPSDLTEGRCIAEDVLALEPEESDCIDESHEWSEESYMYRAWPDCRDAIKYCIVAGCDVGKVLRIDVKETRVFAYVPLSKRDVTYKNGLSSNAKSDLV